MKFEYQKVFNDARNDIKREFGLDLSLIELVMLKEYVKSAIEERKKISKKGLYEMGYDPAPEAVFRFINDYYGIPAHDKHVHFLRSLHASEFREYMRRLQAKIYMP